MQMYTIFASFQDIFVVEHRPGSHVGTISMSGRLVLVEYYDTGGMGVWSNRIATWDNDKSKWVVEHNYLYGIPPERRLMSSLEHTTDFQFAIDSAGKGNEFYRYREPEDNDY
jgi:hypothetical protein